MRRTGFEPAQALSHNLLRVARLTAPEPPPTKKERVSLKKLLFCFILHPPDPDRHPQGIVNNKDSRKIIKLILEQPLLIKVYFINHEKSSDKSIEESP